MKNNLIYMAAALAALAPCSCSAAKPAPACAAEAEAAACPLPQDVQNALRNCAGMKWRMMKPGRHSKPSFDWFPVDAADVAVIKDLLLHKLHAIHSQRTKESFTQKPSDTLLCMLDGNGETLCVLPLCHIAPGWYVQQGGTLPEARYYLGDEDYATFSDLFDKARGITEEPQGNAPAREELVRRYNLGCRQPYTEQTHGITYQLVSGKRLKDSHGPILDGLDIQTDKTYGIAHVYKPRKGPTLGGGILTVIYDPETGAILYAKKSR